MLNQCAFMGRFTKDPELRRTQSGTAVCAFTLAVDRDYKQQDGERETDFIDFVAWRNTAEFVSKYFSKGRMAVVTGSLQGRDWTDKNGNKRRAWEIIANNVYFGDSKKETAPGTSYDVPPEYGYPQAGQQQQFQEIDEEDGNLPF